MASKSAQQEPEKAEVIEEALDIIDTTLDRVKVLYEQYFLGIQKQPPTHIHTDVERRLRDVSQIQIRNTALRYRLATLSQKFGSYNTYWRRTLRQIENGTYTRNLAKVGRQAVKTGEEIPEEILAAMPKRMREQVRRDREAVVSIAKRQSQPLPLDDFAEEELLTLLPEPAHSTVATVPSQRVLDPQGAYELDVSDGEMDYDTFFAGFEDEDDAATPPAAPPPTASTPKPRPAGPGQPPRPATGQPSAGQSPRAATGQPSAGQPVARPAVGQPGPPARASTGQPDGRPNPGQPGRSAPPQPQTTQIPLPPLKLPSSGKPLAPSQVTRPVPIVAGSSTARPAVPVETMSGPFPRVPTTPVTRAPKPDPAPPPQRPPPGMTDADVNALYAKYVKAKEAVGEAAGPGAYGKLLKTINAQAPKIMEQYKAKGVDFSVVVKDNQVIIRAKPKV